MTTRAAIFGVTLGALAVLSLAPLYAAAQSNTNLQLATGGFGSRGLFDCNADGAYSVSAAAMNAVGGSSYVPVNDAAVTLTTGYLVYKECVLSKMVADMRKSATAQLIQQTTTQFLQGRTTTDENGNVIQGPMFPVNLNRDLLALSDTVVGSDLANGTYDQLNPAFRDEVKRTVKQSYDLETKNPGGALACSYSGSPAQLSAILRGQGVNGAADVLVLTDTNCIPLEAYINANDLRASRTSAAQNETLTRLSWNNGVYDVVDANGNVVTPGFIVAGTIQQQIGSGFRQQESATDINQILGAVFANISNQVLNAGLSGLQGLVQRVAGQPAYLSRVVDETTRDLQNTAVNAGLQVLIAAQQNETLYLGALNAVANAAINAAGALRAAESSCWNSIVPKVQSYAATGGCGQNPAGVACAGPFGIRVATSTAFSQGVITSSSLFTSASTTASQIGGSTARLASLNQLLADATSPASTTVKQIALRQIDVLVAGGTLRNQYDVQTVQKQASDAQAAFAGLIGDTAKHWGDDSLSATDQSSGWCNYNDPDVIKMWAGRWKI